ncbi:MAG: type II methionyl aminopeptidase [Thermoplasmata archaeon]|nr:type II methionyl aminopeptidase [Thermoplasmata archaeon]
MNEEELEKYRRAGKIAAEARNLGVNLVREGKTYLEVAEEIEGFIIDRGGKPAFPVNLATDHQAAHYSPGINDRKKISAGAIVKVDVGVHVEGYIADTATTVEVGSERHRMLIDAASIALENAVSLCSHEVAVRKIGGKIEETIRALGFVPVSNLTGHEIKRYLLHGGKSVPNIQDNNGDVIFAGEVVAIEPFASTGSGYVDSDGRSNILRIVRERKLDTELQEFYSLLKQNFGALPFSPRWCLNLDAHAGEKLTKLMKYGVLYEYSILSDTRRGMVSQAEHTVIVGKEGCEVITK